MRCSRDKLVDMTGSYGRDLDAFLVSKELVEVTAGLEVDHIAVKVADTAEFERLLQYVLNSTDYERASFIEENARRLMTAILVTPVNLGGFGETKVVEFMEPKTGKMGNSGQLDHVELSADLGVMQEILRTKSADFTEAVYDKKTSLVVVITEPKKTAGFKPADELDSDMSFSFRGETPRSKRGENVINDKRQEVKFTNGNLGKISEEELESGRAVRIK